MRRGKWVAVAAGLAVVVALVGVKAYRVHERSVQAEAADAACIQAARLAASVTSVPPNSGVKVAVVGDSYSVGATLADPTQTWQLVAARRYGWAVTTAAFPGAGYVNPSCTGASTYRDLLPAAVASRPDFLVVEGGLNDTLSLGGLPARAADLLGAAQSELPAAHIVVLGPVLVPHFDPVATRQVDADLAAAAAHDGIRYVSALDWLGPDLLGPDSTHPTVAGQARFAELVVAAIGQP